MSLVKYLREHNEMTKEMLQKDDCLEYYARKYRMNKYTLQRVAERALLVSFKTNTEAPRRRVTKDDALSLGLTIGLILVALMIFSGGVQ